MNVRDVASIIGCKSGDLTSNEPKLSRFCECIRTKGDALQENGLAEISKDVTEKNGDLD